MAEWIIPESEVPCPVCGADSKHVAYMIVGEPAMDPDMERSIRAGRVALAGCLPPIRDWRDSDEA